MNEQTTKPFTHVLGPSNFDLFLMFLMYSLSFFPQLLLELILFLPQLDTVSMTCGNVHDGRIIHEIRQ